jgi:dienelactone hydrolase
MLLSLVAPAIVGCATIGPGPGADSPEAASTPAAPALPQRDLSPAANAQWLAAVPLPVNLPEGVTVTPVSFNSPRGVLHGYVAKPAGNGPFPTFVWNHGSEKQPGKTQGDAVFFTQHGFVFFVPHRWGQGQSEGSYIMDEINSLPRGQRGEATVRALAAQADDVAAAVAYVRTLPFVDKNRVVIGGCSYGGIQTVLAAERGLGLRAAVDWAGGAMSWESTPELQVRMEQAVRNAKIPVFFAQAENDYSIEPSKVLYAAMHEGHPNTSFVKIYPSTGGDHQSGHGLCVKHPEVWGDDVLNFLNWAMK